MGKNMTDVMDKVEQYVENEFKSIRLTLFFTGGILILLGIWSMTYPIEALLSLALFLGIGFCLTGVNHLLTCFTMRGAKLYYPHWFCFLAFFDLAIGVLMISRLGLSAFMIPLWVALWLACTAVVRVGTSWRLKTRGLRRWWLMLLNALLLLVGAFVMFVSPIIAGLYVAFLLGSILIVTGVLVILEGRLLFSLTH